MGFPWPLAVMAGTAAAAAAAAAGRGVILPVRLADGPLEYVAVELQGSIEVGTVEGSLAGMDLGALEMVHVSAPRALDAFLDWCPRARAAAPGDGGGAGATVRVCVRSRVCVRLGCAVCGRCVVHARGALRARAGRDGRS